MARPPGDLLSLIGFFYIQDQQLRGNQQRLRQRALRHRGLYRLREKAEGVWGFDGGTESVNEGIRTF